MPRSWMRSMATGSAVRMAVIPMSAVFSVLTARITIVGTGVEAYGYVNTIATIFQLVPFADLGVGTAVSNAVARRGLNAEGRNEMYASLLGAVRVLLCVMVVFTAICGTIVYSDLLAQWLSFPPEIYSGGEFAIFLSLSVFFLSLPLSIGYRMLLGGGFNTTIAVGTAIAPMTTTAYSYFILVIDGHPMLFAAGPALGIMVTHIFNLGFAARALRVQVLALLKDVGRVRSWPGGKVVDTAWPMLVITISTAVTLFSHRMLLANFATAEELATYALTVQLFLPAWSVVYMAGSVLWPEFAVSKHRLRTWAQSNMVLMVISGLGGIGLLVVGPAVVNLMNPIQNVDATPFLLPFGVLMVVMGVDLAQTMLLVNAHELRIRSLWAVVYAGLFSILCVPLMRLMGGQGVIWATCVAYFALQTIPNLVNGYNAVRRGL